MKIKQWLEKKVLENKSTFSVCLLLSLDLFLIDAGYTLWIHKLTKFTGWVAVVGIALLGFGTICETRRTKKGLE